MKPECSLSWCVVQSKPRQERKALEHLQNQGFDAWLPCINIEKIKASQRVVVSEPFFSRYLFIRINQKLDNWAPVRSTRGVSQILRQSHQLAVVPDAYIVDLKQRLANSPQKAALEAGDTLKIISGPFKDSEVTFQKMLQMKSGEERAMAFLSILGKEQALCFDLRDFEKVH
jgi:transcriptional antiterminator RfaH